VLELYFLGQHRRDLVILSLVLRGYVEQEYKYLQQEKRCYYPNQRFGSGLGNPNPDSGRQKMTNKFFIINVPRRLFIPALQ
jgi:hypothetical protein